VTKASTTITATLTGIKREKAATPMTFINGISACSVA
jgi:hypothetical protein